LAAIGAGGKGSSDISNSSVNGRERIGALCDVDFAGSAIGTVKIFPIAKLYSVFRELLDNEKDLDEVNISTPDHFMGLRQFMQWKEESMFTYKSLLLII
jgi:hypothetical protein